MTDLEKFIGELLIIGKTTNIIFFREYYSRRDTILFTLDNIYFFEEIKDHCNAQSTMIFDSDSSFYHVYKNNDHYIDEDTRVKVSKRHNIERTFNYHEPFELRYIKNDKITIYFRTYTDEPLPQPKERLLIYLVKKDFLIQDLDKLVDGVNK